MIEPSAPVQSDASVERVLRDELAHSDALVGTIAPILRHLLANDDHSVFSDEIVARVRGMMTDIAEQLLADARGSGGMRDQSTVDEAARDDLVNRLIAVPALLNHTHALALEWQLTQRLQGRLGLDPVLSPLLQAMIASTEPGIAALAMSLLAAQARFCQSQQRMALAITELPGELVHAALNALQQCDGVPPEQHQAAAEAIRIRYDESRSRLGLMTRLVTGMGGGATAALSLNHAGVGLFLTALSLASGQDRAMTALSTNEGQLARLALALKASGLKTAAVEEQFVSLHPEVALPEGFDALGADRAAALLALSAAYPGG